MDLMSILSCIYWQEIVLLPQTSVYYGEEDTVWISCSSYAPVRAIAFFVVYFYPKLKKSSVLPETKTESQSRGDKIRKQHAHHIPQMLERFGEQ
jgi:hypothetical protein